MPKTVMIVDDKEQIVSLVETYLKQEGYRAVTARNGREALFIARDTKPDLIILDLMMPEMDGYEFMRLHRQERETPIILLTARVEDSDKIIGLELGADDYVTKPFSPRELMSRVRAVLRRVGKISAASGTLHVADIMLDRNKHIVTVADKLVELTPSEFDLLAALMATPGWAISRMELLGRIQGVAYDGYERTVNTHIKNLRAKLGDDPRDPHYIETVYGVGYRFAAEES